MNPLDFRNTNAVWSSVLVETLVRCGLRQAVISPGSRSTPLTMALAAHSDVEALPVLDERSAAFFALGAARRNRRAVLLVCTSGSAGAHYLPALIEARETGTPLIVITADRPPEMRECASGQTIDQQKLFGDHVAWYHEFAVPEVSLERLRYLRQTIRQAWSRAAIGPVHLNAPFRDPLPPIPEAGVGDLKPRIDDAFWFQPDAPTMTRGLSIHQKLTTVRGLIVAGGAAAVDPEAYAATVLDLAEATGWPILADALSPVRHHAPAGAPVIAAYDAILRQPEMARDLAPRYVLGLESWPTSKVLREWLGSCQAETLLVSPHPGSRDAIHGRTREVTAPVEALTIDAGGARSLDYRNAWLDAEHQAQRNLAAWMEDCADLFEGKVAWLMGRTLPTGTAVCVANSMPVRDAEYFWPTNQRRINLFASRGANGIDGTLSTALGVAHRGAPTVLLTGDLALLHDANGFLSVAQLAGSLTIVLINNAGGGIFEHLPVAKFEPPFERYFATPQSVDFGQLCGAHNVAHQIVDEWAILERELRTLPNEGVRVLEVRTDRKRDAATRKSLLRQLARR